MLSNGNGITHVKVSLNRYKPVKSMGFNWNELYTLDLLVNMD